MTTKTKSDNDGPTPEEAQAVLVKEQQRRVETARTELEQFLAKWREKHHCRLELSMQVTVQGNVPRFDIVAEP